MEMQIKPRDSEAPPDSSMSRDHILVTHRDVSIEIPASNILSKASSRKAIDTEWVEFNQYLKSMSPQILDQLMAVYIKAEELSDMDDVTILEELEPMMLEVDSLVSYEAIEAYFSGPRSLPIPKDVNNNARIYGHVSDDRNAALTYLPEQYKRLLILSLYLRFFAPMITPSIDVLKLGNRKHQAEYLVYRTFGKTKLWNHETMDRLRVFVNTVLDGENSSIAASMSRVSTASMAEYSIPTLLFRKVMLSRVSDPSANQVSYMHIYIRSQPPSQARNARGEVLTSKDDIDDEGNQSRVDSKHRARSETTIGNTVLYDDRFAAIPERLIRAMPPKIADDPTIRKSMDDFSKALAELRQERQGRVIFYDFQYALINWAIREIPSSYLLELRKGFDNVVALSQAIFVSLGHPLIAAVITAQVSKFRELHDFPSPGQRFHPPREVMARLNAHYTVFPVSRSVGGQDNPRSVVSSINKIIDSILSRPMEINLDPKYGLGIEYLNEDDVTLRTELFHTLADINDVYQDA